MLKGPQERNKGINEIKRRYSITYIEIYMNEKKQDKNKREIS
jgi:hypothetical protein